MKIELDLPDDLVDKLLINNTYDNEEAKINTLRGIILHQLLEKHLVDNIAVAADGSKISLSVDAIDELMPKIVAYARKWPFTIDRSQYYPAPGFPIGMVWSKQDNKNPDHELPKWDDLTFSTKMCIDQQFKKYIEENPCKIKHRGFNRHGIPLYVFEK